MIIDPKSRDLYWPMSLLDQICYFYQNAWKWIFEASIEIVKLKHEMPGGGETAVPYSVLYTIPGKYVNIMK